MNIRRDTEIRHEFDSTQCRVAPQVADVTDLSSVGVQPDFKRYERLGRELSPLLTDSEYTNAVRRMMQEASS